MKWMIVAALAATPALAEPAFEDRSFRLVPHSYTGDWVHFVGGGVAILDCNGDGLPDLFAAGGHNPARLMINEGTFSFSDGGAFATGVTGAYPLDIDADGHMDLAVLRDGANQLLKGDGACGFTDASADWGFEGGDKWTTAFTAGWPDGDLLMVFGNYVDRTNPEGPFGTCDTHALHRLSQGRLWKTSLGPGFCTLSMLLSDWQRSGTPLLRVSNARHYHQDKGYEQMFDLATLAPVADWPEVRLWGMGIASDDVTGDGLPDVMLSSMGDQLLQLNDGGAFKDAPYAMGTFATTPHVGEDNRPSTGWHTEFADVDNDGRLDLFIAKGNVEAMPEAAARDPNNLLLQNADGTFSEVSAKAGVASMSRSRGAGLADFDQDGRLDLVVVNRGAPMEVYRNVTADAGNWLSVEVRQVGANRNAIGSWIEVRHANGMLAREVTVGGGHASGQAGPTHFGLAGSETARVRVIWPDGQAGAWQEVAANTRLMLERDR